MSKGKIFERSVFTPIDTLGPVKVSIEDIHNINEIKISGKTYSIHWTNNQVSPLLGEAIGKTAILSQEIWIDKDTHIEQQFEALIHEILHIIDEDTCMKLQEDGVRRLAPIIAAILLDNFLC